MTRGAPEANPISSMAGSIIASFDSAYKASESPPRIPQKKMRLENRMIMQFQAPCGENGASRLAQPSVAWAVISGRARRRRWSDAILPYSRTYIMNNRWFLFHQAASPLEKPCIILSGMGIYNCDVAHRLNLLSSRKSNDINICYPGNLMESSRLLIIATIMWLELVIYAAARIRLKTLHDEAA